MVPIAYTSLPICVDLMASYLRPRRQGIIKETRQPRQQPARRTSPKLTNRRRIRRPPIWPGAETGYLQQIADHLQKIDEKLRQSDDGGITAIGILGSDVFDKLLVLRALRPNFPEALFFTTDFNAQTHDARRGWSKNFESRCLIKLWP